MNATTESLRHNRESLLAELKAAGADVSKPKTINCPFHEDNHASAGVYEKDGVWRFKCHACNAGGDVFDIRARASKRDLDDVLREQTKKDGPVPQPMPQPERAKTTYPTIERMREVTPHCTDVYRYTNPDTTAVEMVVLRIEPPNEKKSFRQARPLPTGGWVMEGPEKPWPLYNRARVRKADTVVVVEGEKCVHALHGIGIVATTSPGGAGPGKAALSDWSPVAGQQVYLWPDNDPVDPKTHERQGIRHMRDVAKILATLNPPCRVLAVDPDKLGLPPKGDVVDFLDPMAEASTDHKRQAVECVLRDARLLGPAGEVGTLIDDIISGRRKAIAWPWPVFSRLTRALLPGTVTLICGEGGATKSFFLLEAAACWFEENVKVAVFELEDGRAHHARRVLAQRSGCGEIFDDEWIAANPDRARELLAEHADFLDRFGACIHEAPTDDPQLLEIVDWAQASASRGARVIAIDPITAAGVSDMRWLDDQRFMLDLKRTAVDFDVSVVLVTHPRKGRKGGAVLDDLAGGAAYARFAHTVVWLEAFAEPEEVPIRNYTPMGNITDTHEANRMMKLLKTRNAAGTGQRVAFTFDGRTLRFTELGLAVKKGGG